MLQDIVIVDNIFSDPYKIIEIAKKLRYYSKDEHPEESYWSGKRTESISTIDKNTFDEISTEIVFKTLAQTLGKNKSFSVELSWNMDLYFHQLFKSDVYQDSWLHIDRERVYAGVVYLSVNPEPNSGTFLYKENNDRIDIENVFNRLILYKADYLHSSLGGFGSSIDDSRLSLTLFFRDIKFSLGTTYSGGSDE
jgi:hypothetical protein